MAIQTTVIGNLVSDPELRFTGSGVAVANFTIASVDRVFDREKNEWKDGQAVFMRCVAWREMAENIANGFTKGMRIMASGKLRQENYEDKAGDKRSVMKLEVEDCGPSVRFAQVSVRRASRQAQPAQGDAWSTPQEPAF
jgi:single-strand DNA-binding protein